ncbi:YihY/virulence factor BrkB family protein [Devosia rhizoryzae]|uniref:YihY/virulence factor BrkB family protein n=1 Tax=Devosia rhizoryzae TaxID=2774137 RepID=A0ABX7C351_9HYPH|nr:YihY/virulence factor BrkB family protein [Devosia rhizoryzae]QQR38658.1 YihY/virulence factor BrkB family protein [Devosia rhizoryzae]
MADQQRTSDSARGRQADGPQQIPPAGWKDVLLRTYREINDDRVTLIAAAVTYYLLLSLFPTITAFVSIYGLFADPATVAEHINLLSAVVPEGGMAIVNEQLTKLTSTGGSTLGIALLISVAIALWSASSGVKTMFEAMNVAYDERESRNFFKLNATALLFTFGGIVGAMLMIAAAVVVPAILGFIGLGEGFEWLLRIGSYVLLAVVLMLGLAALYRFGPSRQKAKWRWVSPGAALATVIILVVSLLFSWYAANFGNYDATYGSLGGLIALLTWIWISVTAIIIGAELNSEAEKQTRRDSTAGADSPLGQRDATAADTVGEEAGENHGDDDLAGKSAEWVAGFNAAKSRFKPERRHSLGAMAAALPLSIALGAVRRRDRK